MELQYTYSPSKGSMARDTRGIQKKKYKQQLQYKQYIYRGYNISKN